MKKRVTELKPGDRVDLESCPHLHTHSTAPYQYAVVEAVVHETPNCVAVTYEDIDTVGYSPDTELEVRDDSAS